MKEIAWINRRIDDAMDTLSLTSELPGLDQQRKPPAGGEGSAPIGRTETSAPPSLPEGARLTLPQRGLIQSRLSFKEIETPQKPFSNPPAIGEKSATFDVPKLVKINAPLTTVRDLLASTVDDDDNYAPTIALSNTRGDELRAPALLKRGSKAPSHISETAVTAAVGDADQPNRLLRLGLGTSSKSLVLMAVSTTEDSLPSDSLPVQILSVPDLLSATADDDYRIDPEATFIAVPRADSRPDLSEESVSSGSEGIGDSRTISKTLSSKRLDAISIADGNLNDEEVVQVIAQARQRIQDTQQEPVESTPVESLSLPPPPMTLAIPSQSKSPQTLGLAGIPSLLKSFKSNKAVIAHVPSFKSNISDTTTTKPSPRGNESDKASMSFMFDDDETPRDQTTLAVPTRQPATLPPPKIISGSSFKSLIEKKSNRSTRISDFANPNASSISALVGRTNSLANDDESEYVQYQSTNMFSLASPPSVIQSNLLASGPTVPTSNFPQATVESNPAGAVTPELALPVPAGSESLISPSILRRQAGFDVSMTRNRSHPNIEPPTPQVLVSSDSTPIAPPSPPGDRDTNLDLD